MKSLFFFYSIAISGVYSLGEWFEIISNGSNSITPREAHAGAFIAQTNEYLVFGGISTYPTRKSLGDFKSFSLTNSSWTSLPSPTAVAARYLAGHVVDPLNGDFYLHGGSNGSSAFSDLWKFDVLSRSWSQLASSQTTRLFGHCLTWDKTNERIIAYGGSDYFQYYSTFFSYNVQTDSWNTLLSIRYGSLPGTILHGCAFDDAKQNFYFSGGLSEIQRRTVIISVICSISMNGGSSICVNGDVFQFGYSLHLADNTLISFFGIQANGNHTNGVLLYNTNLTSNERNVVYFGDEYPERAVFSTGFDSRTETYYFFGGYNSTGYLNDLWRIEKRSLLPPVASVTSSSATRVGSNPWITTTGAQTGTIIPTEHFVAQSQLTSKSAENAVSITFLQNVALSFTSQRFSTTRTSVRRSSSAQLNTEEFVLFGANVNIVYLVIAGFGFLLMVFLICICWRHYKHNLKNTVKLNMRAAIPVRNPQDDIPLSVFVGAHNESSKQMFSPTQIGTSTQVNTTMALSVPSYIECDYQHDFRVQSKISEGGFGIVYLAVTEKKELAQYGRFIVVKMIKYDGAPDEETVKLFFQEVGLTEYFKDCPNVAKILGYTQKPYCLVMRYYQLGALRQWLNRKNSMTKRTALKFARDIISALTAMHTLGVLHNDLKPDNILLESKGTKIPTCLLSDFGLSQVLTEQILQVKRFRLIRIVGVSVLYAAPEKFDSSPLIQYYQPVEQVLSTDLYAFGITASELIKLKQLVNL